MRSPLNCYSNVFKLTFQKLSEVHLSGVIWIRVILQLDIAKEDLLFAFMLNIPAQKMKSGQCFPASFWTGELWIGFFCGVVSMARAKARCQGNWSSLFFPLLPIMWIPFCWFVAHCWAWDGRWTVFVIKASRRSSRAVGPSSMTFGIFVKNMEWILRPQLIWTP